MTRNEWRSIHAELQPCELRDRIKAAGKATESDEFNLFVGVTEAAESGSESLLVYAVDLIERMWR